MANAEQLAQLKQGPAAWNEWRKRHPRVPVDLSGADLLDGNLVHANLFGANLRGANLARARLAEADLSEADLAGATLARADLGKANLSGAHLADARLFEARFGGANLYGADLGRAQLVSVDFTGASLAKASLNAADLTGAKLGRADLTGADLTGTNVMRVTWSRKTMRGRYMGIRGVESCFGNALFRRDALDQDFLDTLEEHWRPFWWRRALFGLWGFLDYGRSLGGVAIFSAGWIFAFGCLYRYFDLVKYGEASANTSFSAFFFSIVTFTTLGYGDVTPNSLWGEIAASIEVIIGYVTLGLLLSVLAEKVARRS
jgi:hypothetical protein